MVFQIHQFIDSPEVDASVAVVIAMLILAIVQAHEVSPLPKANAVKVKRPAHDEAPAGVAFAETAARAGRTAYG